MRHYVRGIGLAIIAYAIMFAFGWLLNRFTGQDIWYFTTVGLFGLLSWAYVQLEAKNDGSA